jgi:hypothetical protein
MVTNVTPILRDGAYRRMINYHTWVTGPDDHLDFSGELNILAD